ncbi:MAG: hypothetical protein ACREPC_07995 [Stenotrophomonas sp.]
MYVRALLIERELPVDRVTAMHRAVLENAGICWRPGQSIDSLLDTITQDGLAALTDELREDAIEEG